MKQQKEADTFSSVTSLFNDIHNPNRGQRAFVPLDAKIQAVTVKRMMAGHVGQAVQR